MSNSMLEDFRLLLEETFDGPKAHASWYTEAKPGSGLFGSLEPLSAEEASIPVNGTTIAAQADHTRYYLWVALAYLNGEEPEKDWMASWKIADVDSIRWTQIKEELRQEYIALLSKLESLDTGDALDEDTVSGLLGVIAHSAYHLGSIRQMVKAVKR
ncbi:hypothetical protein [Paenibacillus sp. GCM10023250]|uniref:hypothetical protein n=1 Tax=Paenibacillus sp. GCM10023250 TaxID=3252648 RepID=UPI003609872A